MFEWQHVPLCLSFLWCRKVWATDVLCAIQISRFPSPSRGSAGASHFLSKKVVMSLGVAQLFLVITPMAGQGSGRTRRGGAERFEGGAQIVPTAGIRSKVIPWGGDEVGIWCPRPSPGGGLEMADLNHTLQHLLKVIKTHKLFDLTQQNDNKISFEVVSSTIFYKSENFLADKYHKDNLLTWF